MDEPAERYDPPEPDPLFIARFRARIDPAVGESFTPAQLSAIHTAFALRTLPRHSLDIRRSVRLPCGRFYVAVIAGREKRGGARLAAARALRRAGAAADTAILGAAALGLLVIAAGALYLAKMAIGLDLFPGIDMLPDKALLQALLD